MTKNKHSKVKNLYTSHYVDVQLNKFKNRKNNHWKAHIKLIKKLVQNYAPCPPASMIDFGCSIGTFALEFAQVGYWAIGLDFDIKALREGEKLSKELNVSPMWICAKAEEIYLKEKFDIVICFDLLEHVNDKIILRALSNVRNILKDSGVFIFHTFPTQSDHIFYKTPLRCLPLIPSASILA